MAATMRRQVQNNGGTRTAAQGDQPVKPDGRQAELHIDPGVPNEAFHTSSLEYTGHDDAKDDDQQTYKEHMVASMQRVADHVAKTDKVLGRRIRALAEQAKSRFAAVGIKEPRNNNPELFSTATLEASGLEEDPIPIPAVDESQKGGKLQFFGTQPPSKGETGPLERPTASGRRRLAMGSEAGGGDSPAPGDQTDVTSNPDPLPEFKQTVIDLLDKLEPDKYEEHEEKFHELRDELKGMVSEDVTSSGMTYASRKRAASRTQPTPKKRPSRPIAAARTANVSPWNTIKKVLARTLTAGGKWGEGEWETQPEDFGKTLDININTHESDGTPLVAKTITFSLVQEDPTRRTATIEINDGALSHETREYIVPERKAHQLAAQWAKNTQSVVRSILGER